MQRISLSKSIINIKSATGNSDQRTSRMYRVSKNLYILLVTGWLHINCEAHTCGIFKSLSSSPWGKVRTQKWFLCMESSPRRYLIINYDVQWQYNFLKNIIVKLREREGQGVDPGRSLKGHLWMADGGWWISFPWCFTLKLVATHPPTHLHHHQKFNLT